MPVQLTVSQCKGFFSVTVPNAKIWSFDSPNLHTLTVALNNNVDAISVRFGCVRQ